LTRNSGRYKHKKSLDILTTTAPTEKITLDARATLPSYRAATTPIIAASAPTKTGVAAAARLPLTVEAFVVVLALVVEAAAPVPLELPELEVVLLDVVVTLLVSVLVEVDSLELLVLVLELEEVVAVMTIVPEEPPEDVVVAEARLELKIAHSLEPTVAAMIRSEAAQAPIRHGAAREPMTLSSQVSGELSASSDGLLPLGRAALASLVVQFTAGFADGT
jgi:hypothetical protein